MIAGRWLLIGLLPSGSLKAQLTLSGQLRTRTELRDGQGAPLPNGAQPAFFTSQRTRLNVCYSMYRLKFGLSLQDVRVWGQDVSTLNRSTTANNNGLLLHEAWAEIGLTDTTLRNKSLSLKIGRQELVYDDQRLIGNLDWLQQGRRHDAAVLKYEAGPWMLHLAAAYNQNQENAMGTVYNSTPPGNYTATTNGGSMYKSMQFLYAGRRLKAGNVSFLFFADQFSKYHMDTVNNATVKTFQTGAWSRATTGFYFTNVFAKTAVTASAYYQFGNTSTGQKISAALLSGYVQQPVCKSFSVGAGLDYTTGNSGSGTSHTFDPLYGTPHKFWGLMDYYYAASGFGKGGLIDAYLKLKYKTGEKFLLGADLHQFNSASKVILPADPNNTKKSFGQELDIVGTY
ncbi:MAG: alginate export family protein, partial [Bacteroidetes bacterium]|nr:alginate export family protein [Bacteroidota bacterium]